MSSRRNRPRKVPSLHAIVKIKSISNLLNLFLYLFLTFSDFNWLNKTTKLMFQTYSTEFMLNQIKPDNHYP